MNCSGQIEIKCNQCSHINQIQCSVFKNWNKVSSESNASGTEDILEDQIDINCINCNSKISIKTSVFTNSSIPGQEADDFSIACDGGTVISKNCSCIS